MTEALGATNEPVAMYAPGTPERASLKAALERMGSEVADIPLFIGGRDVATGHLRKVRAPHRHALVLGQVHEGGAREVDLAVEAALAAAPAWSETPLVERAAIFLRAADLIATKHRATLNTATMLGQSKTAHQAEIDAACELIDFLRFNAAWALRLERDEPLSPEGTKNTLDLRPLEGFVFAVTPFNFTAIAGNLPTAPALMGNTVVWKPALNAALSGHYIMRILTEAGLPPGVINMVQGDPQTIADAATLRYELAGIHFTGSTAVFRSLWKRVGERIGHYRTFPRLVGETGGKDFVFVHPSADVDSLAVALVRGAFEYQGQKCSAASRLYAPSSLYPRIKERIIELISEIRLGDIADFRNFMGAVIDGQAFDRIRAYVDQARTDVDCSILAGGGASDDEGYFIEPTFIETRDPRHRLMREEIFGPVLAAWVYRDDAYDEALELCDSSTPFALTGAFFADDESAVADASRRLRNAAGNFYVNDKPTGAVVGQQPFGGGRASGTNDKAGSALNLVRWISPRITKENFAPPTRLSYPFMDAE
ncbi:MAG TPA: L-glutamate gamma-semialdehyde dehydrogenase [Polyangiaceae bacterium]|nr:L-glutamate gamma-semialdehyde dehydrogenase [Polyangiaceae bacterium]